MLLLRLLLLLLLLLLLWLAAAAVAAATVCCGCGSAAVLLLLLLLRLRPAATAAAELAVASTLNCCVIIQWQERFPQCPLNLGVAVQWFVTAEHVALRMVMLRQDRPYLTGRKRRSRTRRLVARQGTMQARLGFQAQASE